MTRETCDRLRRRVQACLVVVSRLPPFFVAEYVAYSCVENGARRYPRGSGGALAGILVGICVPLRAPGVQDGRAVLRVDNKQACDSSDRLPIYAYPMGPSRRDVTL